MTMPDRTLLSGRKVPELPAPVTLPLESRCPEKWLAVDLQTGDIWRRGGEGWRRATAEQLAELAALAKEALDHA